MSDIRNCLASAGFRPLPLFSGASSPNRPPNALPLDSTQPWGLPSPRLPQSFTMSADLWRSIDLCTVQVRQSSGLVHIRGAQKARRALGQRIPATAAEQSHGSPLGGVAVDPLITFAFHVFVTVPKFIKRDERTLIRATFTHRVMGPYPLSGVWWIPETFPSVGCITMTNWIS